MKKSKSGRHEVRSWLLLLSSPKPHVEQCSQRHWSKNRTTTTVLRATALRDSDFILFGMVPKHQYGFKVPPGDSNRYPGLRTTELQGLQRAIS